MTNPFFVGTFAADTGPYPGLVVDEVVYDITTVVPDVVDTSSLLRDWEGNVELLATFAQDATARTATPSRRLSEVQILPPINPAGQLFAAGANYREHVIQMTVAHKIGNPDLSEEQLRAQAERELDERARTGEPYVWVGATSAICGANDNVILPEVGSDTDWELELGVIIGRPAYQVTEAEALHYVAGYTICNDITIRSLVPRTDIPMMGTDWMRSKNHPTFFPTGPYFLPSRFVPDPQNLEISLALNGTVMQKGHTSDMIFGVAKLISYISSLVALRPGDMVITGSPQGNGSHWGRFLQEGDVMESTISGLGTQRNLIQGPVGP
ncbi:fumarylacetoacetate hydrolase family protein [Arthrobacter sp. M-10]|uniref:fumarylacetoacetate hydrolase family protein n=1 Tax=Arthrobacter sp. M-10 TaxID=3233037 RepID=UPI003F8F3657